MALLIESQTFPPIAYIKEVIRVKYIKIEACDRFEKTSFRNRYVIATANGLLTLTVPIAGGREQKIATSDVGIDDSVKWQVKHWRSIVSAYRKAPFFEYYAAQVEKLVFSNEKKLITFNKNILEKVCEWLSIDATIDYSETYQPTTDNFDGRNTIQPRNFQHDSQRLPRYSQVFEDRLGFHPNLSILDLLFCEGPNARNLVDTCIEAEKAL